DHGRLPETLAAAVDLRPARLGVEDEGAEIVDDLQGERLAPRIHLVAERTVVVARAEGAGPAVLLRQPVAELPERPVLRNMGDPLQARPRDLPSRLLDE